MWWKHYVKKILVSEKELSDINFERMLVITLENIGVHKK